MTSKLRLVNAVVEGINHSHVRSMSWEIRVGDCIASKDH